MWKKAVPTIALCSFLLVGCNNDEAVPSNNETPMGELNNGAVSYTHLRAHET